MFPSFIEIKWHLIKNVVNNFNNIPIVCEHCGRDSKRASHMPGKVFRLLSLNADFARVLVVTSLLTPYQAPEG